MVTQLLTGATDGIGLALARLWRARGERPWLHGRRPLSTLDPVCFEPKRYLEADLADPGAPQQIQRVLEARGVRELDLLVLNAATGWVGALETLSAERARHLLEVDLVAPIQLTHLLLPQLRRARGRVVFISSIAVAAAAPRYAHYAAAKAAAEGFFRSLALELAGEVEVQVLRLGAVRTSLHEKSGLARTAIPWERFPRPEHVARRIDHALRGSPRWRTLGLGNAALFAFGRWMPGLADRTRAFPEKQGPSEPAPGKRCAITGAAQGIGRALAEEFAREGFELVLIDRDVEGLAALQRALTPHGVALETHACDLTSVEARAALVRALEARAPLELCVHNAGTSAVGPFGTIPWVEQRRVLELNLIAPLELTSALLRSGRLAQRGSMVFIASLSCFVAYPGAAAYAATKDGLAHFSRSLRALRRADGGHVLTVYPGPTRTDHARRFSPDNSREDRRMPPEELAARIARARRRRAHVLVPGFGNTCFAAFGHILPRASGALMRRTLFAKLARVESTSSPVR